jgi:hypothetical protein
MEGGLSRLGLDRKEFHEAIHGAIAVIRLGLARGISIDESGITLNLHASSLPWLFFGAHHGNGNRAPTHTDRALLEKFLEDRLDALAVATPIGIVHGEGADGGRRWWLDGAALGSEALAHRVDTVKSKDNKDGNKNHAAAGELGSGHNRYSTWDGEIFIHQTIDILYSACLWIALVLL